MSYILGIDPGTKYLSLSLLNIKTELIIKWDVISIGLSTDPYEVICKNLADKLEELDFLKITSDPSDPNFSISSQKEVIIITEIQPKKNIRTLVISGQIQMYFTLEKLKNKHRLNDGHCKIVKIVGYHAKNKLKYYEPGPDDKPLEIDHLKKGYYKNKVASKQMCERILIRKKFTTWLTFFMSHSKKDDLSDCLLMCLAYIKFVIGQKRPQILVKNSVLEENENKENLQELENPEKYPKKIVSREQLCSGITANGSPCKYKKYKKTQYCKIHKPKKDKSKSA